MLSLRFGRKWCIVLEVAPFINKYIRAVKEQALGSFPVPMRDTRVRRNSFHERLYFMSRSRRVLYTIHGLSVFSFDA